MFSDFEKRSLRSAAAVQSELGSPAIIHPGRNPKAPFEIMRIFLEAGAQAEMTVMSHLDSEYILCEMMVMSHLDSEYILCEMMVMSHLDSEYVLCEMTFMSHLDSEYIPCEMTFMSHLDSTYHVK